MEDWREVETRRMGRAALEGGLGRGSYVVGAQWDEGNMVHAMSDEEIRRDDGGMEVWGWLTLGGPSGAGPLKHHTHTHYYQHL